MSAAVETLKRRRDFLRVAAAKKNHALRGLVLQASPNTGDSKHIRVGYTASRRVGNAVTRNRARRRLRAAVGEVMPLHAARGYDYVVIARATTVARPYLALRDDLKSALKHLKVWRDK